MRMDRTRYVLPGIQDTLHTVDKRGRLFLIVRRIPRVSKRKWGSASYDGYKKVNGDKLSTLIDRNDLPLACTVSPTDVHDSRLYEPTPEASPIIFYRFRAISSFLG